MLSGRFYQLIPDIIDDKKAKFIYTNSYSIIVDAGRRNGKAMDKAAYLKTKEYVLLLLVIIGVYVGFRYLSPLITPFLFAFAFVTVLHPFLDRMQKKLHMNKSLLAAGILFLLCVTAGGLAWGLIVLIFHKLGSLFSRIDIFEEKFCVFLSGCCDGMEQRFGVDGDGIETYIIERVNVFIDNFQIEVVPRIMNESIGYVKSAAAVVSFLAIMLIAAVLLAKDYTCIMEKLRNHEELKFILRIGKKIFHHAGTFVKAQLAILLIISLISAVVLSIGGIEGGIFIGLFTGFMDMLPFIGTGIVLMPLAFWQILNGYYLKAVVCVLLYVVCVITREILEPKLIGEKVGIFPVGILFSVYAGVKLFGIFGIIKGPLALITIYEIYLFMKERTEEAQGEKRQMQD